MHCCVLHGSITSCPPSANPQPLTVASFLLCVVCISYNVPEIKVEMCECLYDAQLFVKSATQTSQPALLLTYSH